MARILFVAHTADLSGSSNSLLRLLKYAKQEHEVAVVVPRSGPLVQAVSEMGIPFHVMDRYELKWPSIPALAQYIVVGKFDVVYGNNVSSGTRNALVAAKLVRRPFIWHVREMLGNTRAKVIAFLRYADAIIAVSQASAAIVRQHVGTKSVDVVYNGIEIDDFSMGRDAARSYLLEAAGLPADSIVVVNLGVVSPLKNQQATVEIVENLVHRFPGVVLIVVGSLQLFPGYAQHVRDYVNKHRLEQNVRFLDLRDDVPALLQGADIMIHTSKQDANPRSILEAMAAKLPVVAFDVGGIPEMVVDGKTGYVVPFGDIAGMVESIVKLLEDSTLRERLGLAGRKRVLDSFDAAATARSVNRIIDAVLAR